MTNLDSILKSGGAQMYITGSNPLSTQDDVAAALVADGLGRKVMTNLDSILKSRDITLPTKVRLVKAMVFPVVMY